MIRQALHVNRRVALLQSTHRVSPRCYTRLTCELQGQRVPRPSYSWKSRRQPIRAQSSATILVAVGVTCVSVVVSYIFYDAYIPQSGDIISATDEPDVCRTGTIDMPELLAGRPDNLTVEQKVKLQEFWKASLKVFGVPNSEVSDLGESVRDSLVIVGEDDDDEVESQMNGKFGDADDKKKKRRNIFGRKKKDRESSGTPKKLGGPKADSDDKYGQTKEFYSALANNTPEEIRGAFWTMVKHDNPDGLLLRFLRARKWDVEKALVMMVSTLHWRLNEMHVDDDIMKNGEMQAAEDSQSSDPARKKSGEDFLAQLRLGKSFLHGIDKEGRPMCTVRVRLHHQGEQAEASLERFTVFTIETARLLVPKPPIDTAAIVFDMTDFGMANMDYTPVKFMIKCFEANYPESLGVVLVHKAPWIFQGIWKIIRGWLDPVVASKIQFTSNMRELENYVPRDHIIHELGGDEDWTYEYPEVEEGENDRMKDTVTRDRLLAEREVIAKEYEEATREWIRGPPDEGSVLAERSGIATRLRKNYWQLDPYVRARSWYDRIGVIGEGGETSFYEVYEDALEHPYGASGGILEPGLARLRSRDSSRMRTRSKTPSRNASRSGPSPAEHDADGVD